MAQKLNFIFKLIQKCWPPIFNYYILTNVLVNSRLIMYKLIFSSDHHILDHNCYISQDNSRQAQGSGGSKVVNNPFKTISFVTTMCLGRLNSLKLKILAPIFKKLSFRPLSILGDPRVSTNMFLAHIISEGSEWSKSIFTNYVYI